MSWSIGTWLGNKPCRAGAGAAVGSSRPVAGFPLPGNGTGGLAAGSRRTASVRRQKQL